MRVLPDKKDWQVGRVTRADVADFLVREAFEARYVGQTPLLIQWPPAMSNWRNDPEGAAEQLIRRSLDDIEVRGRVLLAYASADLASLLAQSGAEVASGTGAWWVRRRRRLGHRRDPTMSRCCACRRRKTSRRWRRTPASARSPRAGA